MLNDPIIFPSEQQSQLACHSQLEGCAGSHMLLQQMPTAQLHMHKESRFLVLLFVNMQL